MQILIDVIVMLEESARHLDVWSLKSPSRESEMGVLTDDDYNEERWRQLSFTINKRAREGNYDRIEVFLFLRKGLRATIPYSGVLRKIAGAAQRSVWASNVYVVWEKSRDAMPPIDELYDLDNANMLVDFYGMLLEQRVSGLIEIPRSLKRSGRSVTDDVLTLLHGVGVSSRAQRSDLKDLVRNTGWSYLLRNEARWLDYVLERFTRKEHISRDSPNQLLIFESSSRLGPGELLDKCIGRPSVVVTTNDSYTAELLNECTSREPPVALLRFHSVFEIIYALLQLNEAARIEQKRHPHSQSRKPFDESLVKIQPVEVTRPRFSQPQTPRFRNLLVTSAFDEQSEPNHAKAAANEIWAIRRNVATFEDVDVYPYMSCHALPDILERREYVVWVHLSHGSQHGLYDSKQQTYVSPESWLNCFRAHHGTLVLALFSSCESARAAQLFAEAGVPVAIGFQQKVLPAATEILAEEIVPAALLSGGNDEIILNAFRNACMRLSARVTDDGENYADAQPIAFRSVRS